jgi:hypothetical protein
MTRAALYRLFVPALCLLTACGGSETPPSTPAHGGDDHAESHADEAAGGGEDHAHAEESLGTARIGDLEVELAQGHGGVVAGQEAHLVVKLPYTDGGATEVRAWIGTDDRTLSYVGRGEYAPSHDDYDVHATAPDPLPAAPLWWVEIAKPDGTTLVGSAKPLLD